MGAPPPPNEVFDVEQGFYAQYGAFAVITLVAMGFYLLVMVVNRVMRPTIPSPLKLSTYECGVEPVGTGWAQMNIRYYVFAFLFVIFDVEAVFLLPWAVLVGRLGPDSPISPTYAVVVMFLFIGTLLEGLMYAWKKGVLTWE